VVISTDTVASSWITASFDWSNRYLAIPLGLLAFGVAIWQIRDAKKAAGEAKTAADAAKQAADGAIANFKSRSIAALIPQLSQLEDMIARASTAKSADFLSHAIHTWGWQAATCRELLNQGAPNEKKTMQKIQRSTSAAHELRKELLTVDTTTDWDAMTLRFRRAVVDVTTDLQAIAAALVVKEPS